MCNKLYCLHICQPKNLNSSSQSVYGAHYFRSKQEIVVLNMLFSFLQTFVNALS
jgi:hypothetical protein